MYTANNTRTGDTYHFHKLESLVRRLGGSHWSTVEGSAFSEPVSTVQILHWLPKADSSEIVATLHVPHEAAEEAAARKIVADQEYQVRLLAGDIEPGRRS